MKNIIKKLLKKILLSFPLNILFPYYKKYCETRKYLEEKNIINNELETRLGIILKGKNIVEILNNSKLENSLLLTQEDIEEFCKLKFYEKIFTKEQFINFYKTLEDELEIDKILSKLIFKKTKEIYIYGFCQICKKPTYFLVDSLYSNNQIINFRERMVCQICDLNNRQRYLLFEINKNTYDRNLNIYIYEQVTPFYKTLKNIYPNTIGSEYLGLEYKSGDIKNGILHQTSEYLSFPDNSFDLVISLDVFEHVYNLEKSLMEAFRILKPSGKLFFSIPFYCHNEKTILRAKMIDGDVVFLKEPQYHGNPVSEKGSLVVNEISWDLFDILKKCGFKESYISAGYNRITGNIGSFQYFFNAIK
jgi:SAM-dependent methyltransferase